MVMVIWVTEHPAVEQGYTLVRRPEHARDGGNGDYVKSEVDKADNVHNPHEANMGEELLVHDWPRHTAHAQARNCDPEHSALVPLEVG